MNAKLSEIRSLTGLRGVAALYVVIFHALIFPSSAQNPLATFLNNGYLAVDLFFILSGFVMGMVHGQDFENGFNLGSYKNFLTKRLARIYPLYFIVLSITVALYYFHPARIPEETGSLTAVRVVENYFLIQGWGLGTSYVQPSWSVSTEIAAYLLFPVLALLTLFQSRKVTIFVAILFLVLPALVALVFVGEKSGLQMNLWNGETFGPMTRCITEFTIGLLCYRFYQWQIGTALMNKKWVGFSLMLAILVLLTFKNSDLLIVMLLPFLILSLASDKTPLAKLMGSKPVHWLGLISYSVYLVHSLVFYFREDIQALFEQLHIPHAYTVSLVLFFPQTIALGASTYYCIEKPMRNLLRNISAKHPVEAVV